MKAINKYKSLIQELRYIFANLEVDRPSLPLLEKEQAKVMHYANRIADEIKDELIGDGDEAKFKGRLKTAFFELGADPNFAPSYFPVFDEALFELPGKDYPDRNKEMVDALTDVYGGDAADVMVSLQTTAQWANFMVQDMAKMLDEVCKFVGYTPEPQQGEQQKDLHYYCEKAVEKGYLVKVDGGYKRATWSKALLAYFLKHFLNTDGTFPDKEYCVMFGESRLSKAADQLSINKNGDGKPRGYEIVDELLQG